MKNGKWKIRNGKWFVFFALLLIAAAFRIAVAHWLPNDAPGDSIVYSQIARNVLEQHAYSHATEPPYDPSLIRLPGYPLFLAGIYEVFGHGNNGAVRMAQALMDTATCGLVALLAFYWQPNKKRKRATAIAALALAAVCPFTTIYAATILTEVPTNFLAMAMLVAGTLAFRSGSTTEDTEEDRKRSLKKSILWWGVAGLLGGLAVLLRPDSGLFAGAVGMTLVISGLLRFRKEFSRSIVRGAVFSLAFIIVLTPWTIRNWRVFHLFQPLAPAHGEMPGEFVPRGYTLWLRTWLDDESYVAPFLWSLDTDPIDIDDVPPYAYDSVDEKNRVAALLDKYNHADGEQTANATPTTTQSQPNSSPTPPPSSSPTPTNSKAKPSENPKANSNSNTEEESADENDNSNNEEANNEEQTDESQPEEHGPVEMTPEIDAGFAQLARERIARHRFQFYVSLPLKRARTMWFDTHSQYWPFEGALLPWEDLDYDIHQEIWLPLFAALTAIYTLLGLAGGWVLWVSEKFAARRWLLLTALAIALRLILFSSIENPEPRYLVEFFPFLSILGGIAAAQVLSAFHKQTPAEGEA